MSKLFFFYCELSKKYGLGHFYRCFSYSKFLKKGSIVYFIISKNNFSKNVLKGFKKKNKINYIFHDDITSINKIKKLENKDKILFIDTYKNKKFFLSNKNNFFKKTIYISDTKKINFKTDYVIDHTFLREKSFYKYKLNNNRKFKIGLDYFPITFKNKKSSKKNVILINFGSTKDNILIKKSLKIIEFFELFKKNRIIILSRSFNKKFLNKIKFKNRIKLLNKSYDLEKIYHRTFLTIGSCGISLYERSFLQIPSICVPVSDNQYYNYKNFLKANLIISFKNLFNDLNTRKDLKFFFFKQIMINRTQLKHYFKLNRRNLFLKKFMVNL